MIETFKSKLKKKSSSILSSSLKLPYNKSYYACPFSMKNRMIRKAEGGSKDERVKEPNCMQEETYSSNKSDKTYMIASVVLHLEIG